MISVITATYNAVAHLPTLIDSLRKQSCKQFEWVVADGVSTDGTLELLQSINDFNVKVISSADFGIYDALNKGIKAASGDYYVVIGADDFFFPDAIANYVSALDDEPDVVAAGVRANGRIVRPGQGASWRCGHLAFVSVHAVGTLFKRSLHQRFGYYSRKFPIAADQLFIKNCCQSDIKLKKISAVMGEFGVGGVSSVDAAGTLSEFFRVQLLTESNKLIQVLIYVLRLARHYSRL